MKILFVDDDELTGEFFKISLKRRGILNITITLSGFDGLKAFEKNEYDIVITDVSMPGMNGIEMALKIAKINKNAPIIFISSDYDNKTKILENGFKYFYHKPVNFDILANNIQSIINGWEI